MKAKAKMFHIAIKSSPILFPIVRLVKEPRTNEAVSKRTKDHRCLCWFKLHHFQRSSSDIYVTRSHTTYALSYLYTGNQWNGVLTVLLYKNQTKIREEVSRKLVCLNSIGWHAAWDHWVRPYMWINQTDQELHDRCCSMDHEQ